MVVHRLLVLVGMVVVGYYSIVNVVVVFSDYFIDEGQVLKLFCVCFVTLVLVLVGL